MKCTVYPAFILNQEAKLLRKCADTYPLFLRLAPYKKKKKKDWQDLSLTRLRF